MGKYLFVLVGLKFFYFNFGLDRFVPDTIDVPLDVSFISNFFFRI